MIDFLKRLRLDRLAQKVNSPRLVLVKIAIVTGLLVALALMFPRGESLQLDYRTGAVWAQKDLIAPFSFPIFREEKEYQRDVEEAKQNVYPVFEQDTSVAGRQLRRLDEFFRRVAEAANAELRSRSAGEQSRAAAHQDSLLFSQLSAALDIPFTETEWLLLENLVARKGLSRIQRLLESFLQAQYAKGILDRNKNTIAQQDIALRRGKLEEITPVTHMLDRNDVVGLLEKQLLQFFRADNDTVSLAYKIGVVHIAPSIKFSEEASALAVAAAVDGVQRTTGFVQENERIVSKHERITPDTRLKLESLRRAKVERGPASDTILQLIGNILHVSIPILLYGIYLFLFRKKIFENNHRLALVALLILLEGFFAYLSRELDVVTPIEYLIFIPAASMLLTIIFDSRVGFYGTVIIAFVVAGIRGNDYSIALASLAAGALSVYSVRDMKTRTQLFRSLGFIFAGYAIVIISLGLERYEPTRTIFEQLSFAMVNAIVSPVLTYGLLIFLERVFKATTDLTLMELAHYNHPLLRLLAEKAPGTHHHSMTIASIAEAAAASIGANGVLVRVGAYFHDVGKVVKPTYFVENQRSSRSRHDKLSPRMSSLIIAAHVKDGIALAREHKLPEEVIDFIPMHHGTTRIDYFYNKALQLAQSSDDETKLDEINEQDYRYPGPKPQTRETGILMLADAVEAAVRTIEEPTPQRLADAIDELVKRRLDEGELDECPLTLRDLTRIKSGFLSVLVGMYHTRVKYPAPPRPRLRRPPQKGLPAQDDPAAQTDDPTGMEPS
jgi:putative nucleotidyltransferase with HDIG domain